MIEICEHVIIVLQLVNSSEFDTMALELYGDPHLLTWIEAAHVTTAATDTTCRIGRSDVVNHDPGALGEPELRIPGQQVDIGEHAAESPSRLPRFVALRLNRVRVSHAGLVHQIFDPPAILDAFFDFGRQFVRNVD